MKHRFLVTFLILGGLFQCAEDAPNDYPIKPVVIKDVRINEGFWASRLETSRFVTIPHAFTQCEITGLVDNFEIAAGTKTGKQSGVYSFDDTDVYKTIEGAAYTLMQHPNEKLSQYLDELIAKIAAAQADDGYLFTARNNNPDWLVRRAGTERWSYLAFSHELYNAGHLFEAAAAHYQATGKQSLLDVALKFADLIDSVFGPDGIQSPPGHQEIEIGLVKLYRVTGEKRYLDLAKFFLDERGYSKNGRELWGDYAQDHQPVFDQEEAVGHAVRLPYMGIALTDVAALTGDRNYLEASVRLWENVVNKKFYITGGLGSVGIGERFAGNYELPNLSAYQETCTSIANVLWNHRLFLHTGDAKYLDVLERSLYNTMLAGVALEGNRFFYPNVLASRGYHERSGWFICNCCITNLSRIMPFLPEMVFATAENSIFVNLFTASGAMVSLAETNIYIRQETSYPENGKIRLTIDPETPENFELRIRIPGWAQEEVLPGTLYQFLTPLSTPVRIAVNGEEQPLNIENGFARIQRNWEKGDVVEVELPMPVRQIVGNENLVENRGKVALQRGPLVYCLEGPDNPDGRVLNLALTDEQEFTLEYQRAFLGGVTVLKGEATAFDIGNDRTLHLMEKQPFTAIPYYAWAHRGMHEMTVWVVKDPAIAKPLFGHRIAENSQSSSSGGEGLSAINDAATPGNSRDRSNGAFIWNTGGDTVWVQYDFEEPQEVSEAAVYWLIDELNGGIQPPSSWRVLAKIDGKWAQVYTPLNNWDTEKNQFNRVIFETLKTGSLRLEAVLPDEGTSGILEWEVN